MSKENLKGSEDEFSANEMEPESDDYQSADDGDCTTTLPRTQSSVKQPATNTTTMLNNVASTATQIPHEKNINFNKNLDEAYPMHRYVFEDDYKRLSQLLKWSLSNSRIDVEIARKDKHGNTALHLAVMLGRKECIQLLLTYNAPVKIKNNDGWSPLSEAISYGDRETIVTVLRKLKQQSRHHMEGRRMKLVQALRQMKDFYMELKWDFQSWVPLVSRILPSDICRIHKCGASLRLDTTLVDFNDMRWERGDISFIFRGELPPQESLIVLDNELECYQHVRYEDADMEDEVDLLMSTDILATQMSTKNINFARAQSGWIFRADRKETISGKYICDMYTIQGLVLKQRKRREHLSHEDLQKNRAIVETITKGNTSHGTMNALNRRASNANEHTTTANDTTDTTPTLNGSHIPELVRRCSLPPPPASSVTWSQYIDATPGNCPLLGRAPVHKQSNKTLRATVAMSKDFPLSVDMLLDVLEVIAPIKHINKLREFVKIKLPVGFPVKIEIPVLRTVTAKVTFQKFEFCDNIPSKLFEVPQNYWEDIRRFQDL